MGGLRRTGAQLSGVAVEPMGMALSVSGNHFARHTTLILLVSLLPSAQSSRPGLGGGVEGGCIGRGGSGGVGDTGIAAGPMSASLFEDRQHCITLRYLVGAS